jgi:hypothetical protein
MKLDIFYNIKSKGEHLYFKRSESDSNKIMLFDLDIYYELISGSRNEILIYKR